MNSLPNWLRWVLFLPFAIFCGGLCYSFFYFIGKHIFTGDNGYGDITSVSDGLKIAGYFGRLAGSIGYMLASYYIVPSHKLKVSLVAMILALILFGFYIFSEDINLARHAYYFQLIKDAIACLGIFIGYIACREEGINKNLK